MRYCCLTLLLFFSICASAQRDIYAVIVGVADYKNDNLHLDLRYSDDDAKDFYHLLIEASVPKNNIALLLNHQASRSSVIYSMNKVFRQADKDDEIIFFFSGHGSEDGLLVYDFDLKKKNFLSFEDIKAGFKKSPASRKLLFADACFSGAIRAAGGKKKSRINKIKANSEVAIFLSSRYNQHSIEYYKGKNGLFTYYLLKALRGAADVDFNHSITAYELFEYVHKNVNNISKGNQTPVMFGKFDKEMDILLLK